MAGLYPYPIVGRTVSGARENIVNGWPVRPAPPTSRKNVPRTPPSTPIGVSIASINGKLTESSVNLDPFSIGQLTFQIRYRYEFMPLAYLYAVYTRGGKIYELDEEDDLGTLYKRPWEEPSKDNFTVKVRYRF